MRKAVYLPKHGITAHFMHRDDMRPKHAPKRAFRTHKFAAPATTLPVDCTGTGCQWPMYLNDTYGDCGEAMAGHTAGILSYGQGKRQEILFQDADIQKQYFFESGGDNGMDEDMEADVWLYKGVCNDARCKALEKLDIDPNDTAMVNYCLDQFYCLNLAWSVPDAFLNSFTNGSSWLQPMQPDPANGHYTTITNIDAQGNKTLLTWGAKCTVSDAFIASVQPSYFVLFSLLQFDPATGYDSHGRHVTTQIAAWNAIGGHVDPSVANAFPPASGPTPVPPTPTPTPTPTPVPTPAPVSFTVSFPQGLMQAKDLRDWIAKGVTGSGSTPDGKTATIAIPDTTAHVHPAAGNGTVDPFSVQVTIQ